MSIGSASYATSQRNVNNKIYFSKPVDIAILIAMMRSVAGSVKDSREVALDSYLVLGETKVRPCCTGAWSKVSGLIFTDPLARATNGNAGPIRR